MNPDDLVRILDELGERLGPTGEFVFALAVRQVYIDAITMIVLSAAYVVALAVAVPRVARWIADGDSYDGRGLVGIFGGVGATILGVLLLVGVLWYVPALFNPGYAALRNILGAVQP